MTPRAVRRHHKARLARERRKIWERSATPGIPGYERSDNQLASRHPFDCGRRCLLCHGEKFLTPRRAREKRAWKREHGV